MKAGEVHIYRVSSQPATHFFDRCGETPMEFSNDPDKMMWAHCCVTQRPASELVVQCYYDGYSYWCAEGKGCKDPVFIKAKADREFKNRSEGQKRRYSRAALSRVKG